MSSGQESLATKHRELIAKRAEEDRTRTLTANRYLWHLDATLDNSSWENYSQARARRETTEALMAKLGIPRYARLPDPEEPTEPAPLEEHENHNALLVTTRGPRFIHVPQLPDGDLTNAYLCLRIERQDLDALSHPVPGGLNRKYCWEVVPDSLWAVGEWILPVFQGHEIENSLSGRVGTWRYLAQERAS